MIYKAKKDTRKNLIDMFRHMDDTMILSCLQGYMGDAWVDNIKNPKVAQVIVGVFVFYAGDCSLKEAEELLYNLPEYALIIVNTPEWKRKIETIYNNRAEKFKRYSFKKNPKYLDVNHIKSFLQRVPDGYELKRVNSYLAHSFSFQELSKDFTSQFQSIDDYLKKGIGYCILKDDKVICCASSYSVYDDGIEIEIDTHPLYRRKGLATIAASALILDCLNRGKYPSWDAANMESVKLAQKLGYVLEGAYDTYCVNNEKFK